MRFAERVAVITGGSRGIGREIAKQLSAEGATVLLVARSEEGLRETLNQIEAQGGQGEIFPVDFRNTNALQGFASSVIDRWKGVDIIVNNAGVWHDGSRMYANRPFAETPLDELDEVLDVGLRAPMLLTSILLPGMLEAKRGKILQVSGGFAGASDAVGWLHYFVAKKAIEHFTQGLAEEVRGHEIQVNCISPWFVATEPVCGFFPEEAHKAIHPRQIAQVAAYLLSQEADHITGQIVAVRNKTDH